MNLILHTQLNKALMWCFRKLNSTATKHRMEQADRELAALGETNPWMIQDVKDMLMLMSIQGHSGGSAPFLIRNFSKLASWEPLSPLMGTDNEWQHIGEDVYQNIRYNSVFKENGAAYDITGRIFIRSDGSSFTNQDSHVPVEFPYTPIKEYVNVPDLDAA